MHGSPVPRYELPADASDRRLTGNGWWRPGGDARRRLFKILRILLPSFMAVVVGVAIFFPEIFPTRGRAPIDIAVVDESVGTDGKGMVDVTYSGIDKEGRPFSLSAKGVRSVPDNARVLLLTEPGAQLSLKDGSKLKIEAEAGRYDRAADAVDLEGARYAEAWPGFDRSNQPGESGTRVRHRIKPVEGEASFGTIAGEGFRVAERGETIFVEGPAHLLIDSGAKPPLQ